MIFAAFFISSIDVNLPNPDNWPASNKLGVTTVALGNKYLIIASVFPGLSTSSSPLHTITGSTTKYFAPDCSNASPARLMISSVPSIPVLTASGPIEMTVSNCFSNTSIGSGVTSWDQVSLSIVTTAVKATIP